MKPSWINGFVMSTVLAIIGCALGCSQSGEMEGTSSTGSGGAYSGQPCLWGGSGGGLSFPVCPAPKTSGTCLPPQHQSNRCLITAHLVRSLALGAGKSDSDHPRG